MKSLVLAEKPSVGRELARVLGCGKKTKSYMEGNSYIVTWAMGHLVELAEPEVYDDRYKTWALDYLPMLPERMRLKVIRRTSHQFNVIKGLMKRGDVGSLVIATDAGREGELVARWIMRLGAWKGPFQRLWISSQTDTAIREGFKNLKPGKNYDSLMKAAESRAEADWIIGLNVTRALSCRHDARLSAGRVQTPTLSMIVQREAERENFKPEAYRQITAEFGELSALWNSPNGNTRIFDEEYALALADKLEGKSGTVTKVTMKDKKQAPPAAFDLTELQRESNRVLGFSAKKTLQVLQGLYERHKIVTYPRTDSRFITEDMVPTLPGRLKALGQTPFRSTAEKLLKSPLKPGKNFVNNSRVTDHHAIIPTEERVKTERLNSDERSLWDLIVRRFLAVLSSPFQYRQIDIVINVEGETFTARGKSVRSRGWREIGGTGSGDDADEQTFPEGFGIKEGTAVTIRKITAKQDWTKPPGRYTEATLLSAMERPGKFIKDEALKKSLEDEGTAAPSLGTPATRADIIEKLLSSYYIERQGKELVPTPLGIELMNLVPKELKSPALTARWEQRLAQIEKGKGDPGMFRNDMRIHAKKLVTQVKEDTVRFSPDKLSDKACPLCGRKMMPVKGKKGEKLFICPALSCGFEENEVRKGEMFAKPTKKEKAIARKLMNQYSDKSKETFTLADMLKAAEEKKKKR